MSKEEIEIKDYDLSYTKSFEEKIIALGNRLELMQDSLRIIQERLNEAIILQSQLFHKILKES